MSKLIADIFMTVGGRDRIATTVKSLQSLLQSTDRLQFRLTICYDGVVPVLSHGADYVLTSIENEGLGPTINRAVAHICSINDWYSHPTHGAPDNVAPFIVCCQDDCEYEPNWLPTLASRFIAYERLRPIAFASGHDAIEHPVREVLGDKLLLKDWIRMTNVMGRREYWRSLMPIPRLDPETGRVRARPNDGVGSSVDWHIIRNHENSVCRTGQTCLVIPGLVRHIGYDKSTWLDRELPESDYDKSRMR